MYKVSCLMSDVACCVCNVYSKMCDMCDIGMMLGGKGARLVSKWVCKKLTPPTQEKNKKNQRVEKDQAKVEKLEKRKQLWRLKLHGQKRRKR